MTKTVFGIIITSVRAEWYISTEFLPISCSSSWVLFFLPIMSVCLLPQFQGRFFWASPAVLYAALAVCSPAYPGQRFSAPPELDRAPCSPLHCAAGPVAALHSDCPLAADTPQGMTWNIQQLHKSFSVSCIVFNAPKSKYLICQWLLTMGLHFWQLAAGRLWTAWYYTGHTGRSWCIPPASLLDVLNLPAESGCSWFQST